MIGTLTTYQWVWATGREKLRVVLNNIRGLVRRVGFPAPYNFLDVLCFVECSLRDSLRLVELCPVMLREQAGAEFRVAEICWLEEFVWATDADMEVLCMV